MKGPIQLVRSDRVEGVTKLGPIYEWSEDKAYLTIDQITYGGKQGAILCYYNPPVHQVGNPGLDAYLEGLDKVFKKRDTLEFLIFYGPNVPIRNLFLFELHGPVQCVQALLYISTCMHRVIGTIKNEKLEFIFFLKYFV